MFDVKNKKILVLGLGASGFAAAELLARKGARVSVSESSDGDDIQERLEGLKGYKVRHELGGHTARFCSGMDLVVTSPGIDAAQLMRSGIIPKGSAVIGELELGYVFCGASVIAITGTNGKSTTTKLIGEIISGSGKHTVVCGNIGNPLSGEVGALTEDSIAVVEVSSFQLQTIRTFRPRIAVLLNVAEDHYDRHTDLDSYKAAKYRIFRNQSGGDWAVLHCDLRDDPMTNAIGAKTCFYGAGGREARLGEKDITVSLDGAGEFRIPREEIPLEGEHNIENVACAALVSKIAAVDNGRIREGIRAFKGLGHRFQRIGGLDGVEFIDDSKATNLDATRRALQSLDKRVVLIAGGIDKGGDYGLLLPFIRDKVKAIVVIGEAREKIKKAFSGAVPVLEAADMAKAVRAAHKEASKGETVMLSPMCSSFDMFTSYKHRGEVFQNEVRKIMDARGAAS